MTENNIGFDIGENCNIELLNQETIDFWANDNGDQKLMKKLKKNSILIFWVIAQNNCILTLWNFIVYNYTAKNMIVN